MTPAGRGAGDHHDAVTPPDRIVIAYVPERSTPFGEPVRSHQLHLMATALRTAGWSPAVTAFDPATPADSLSGDGPSVVFNLCYGWRGGDGQPALGQPELAARLGATGELVGSETEAQRRCQDKRAAGRVATEAGLAAPGELDPATVGDRPVVVKPRHGAAHRRVRVVTGPLDEGEVAADELVQEYVDGPEFSVSVVALDGAPRPLTAARIRYGRQARDPRLYDWATTTFEPVPATRFGLADAGLRAFEALGLRDYARFDFRVAGDGTPVLLDANSLPSLAPRQILATAARWDGIAYDELIGSLAVAARRRLG